MTPLKFILDLLTDHDNDGEIVSVLGTMAMLVLLGLSVFVSIHTKTFDVISFGSGVGLVLAGLGGGYWSKSKGK